MQNTVTLILRWI